MNRIARQWTFLAWAAAALMTQSSAGAAEESATFGNVDAELRMALESSPGPGMTRHLGSAEQLLAASSRQRRGTQAGADLEVDARAAIIDAIRNAATLGQAGNQLEAVRALSKLLELARSLWELASTRNTAKPNELDQLVSSIYRRLQQVAGSDRSAQVEFGPASGSVSREKLLFRVFTLSRKQLVAFELYGNAAQRVATWRETQLRASPHLVMSAIDEFFRQSDAGRPQRLAEQPAFVMLLSGAVATNAEQQLQRAAGELLGRGVVLIALNPRESDRPFTLIPSIESPAGLVDLVGAGALLIYRKTGSELYRWDKLPKAADIDRAATDAGELATELYQDIEPGRNPPAFARADLPMFLPAAPRRQVDAGKQFAVIEPLEAAVVDARDRMSLKPSTPLALSAVGPAGWAQYAPEGSNQTVWLRPSQVGPYRPPAKPPGEIEDKAPGKSGVQPLLDRLRAR